MIDREQYSISFESIFGTTENLDMDKLDQFLAEMMEETFKNANHSPNELIRVVDRGAIRWMTAEQAEDFLHQNGDEEDQEFQHNLQMALRGDSRILSQELRILLLLAIGTMKKYETEQAIPMEEIRRLEIQLTRLSRNIHGYLGELSQIESRIKDTRQRNPILDEFEGKMGKLLNFQKEGENNKALELAKELAAIKKRYVLLSKGLINDNNLAYHCRLDLQRQKKSVLSSHRYMAAQREGALQEELLDLRKSIDNIKSILARESGDGRQKYEQMLDQKHEVVVKDENELQVVQHEQAVLEKKENETEAVISHIQDSVLCEKVEKEEKATPAPSKPETPENSPKEEKESHAHYVHRMARSQRRD